MDIPLATGAGVVAAVFIPVQYTAKSGLYLGTAGTINPFEDEEGRNNIFTEYGPRGHQTTPQR